MNWEYEKLYDDEKPHDFRENFENWEFPVIPIETSTAYGWRVFGYDEKDPKKLKIGFGSDISVYTAIFAHNGVIIQPYVQIGPHCSILSRSTIDNKEGQVTIGKNARIGAYSTVMPGITIGENSIIGAYSFVNKNIPPDTIAYGKPCRVKKSRVNEN